MSMPTRKPKHFDVVTGAGVSIKQPCWYRLSIQALRKKMREAAEIFDDEVDLINTDTRNYWTVTPEGIWK